MYQKVHLRLTILCAGITAAIMIIMSLGYLYISENNLYENQYNSFKNDMNTISTNLEQQSVITMEWLSKMEAQNSYTFFVLDNEIPFLYNSLSALTDSLRQTLFTESMETYHAMLSSGLLAKDASSSLSACYHSEFRFSSKSSGKEYYCSVIEIKKEAASLQVIILSSLDLLEKQILDQRIRFILIDSAAILLLTVFSFIFTGKLLKPVIENQQKQTRFIASASHELRTPLAVILSSAECCKNTDFHEQNVFIKNICQEGLRMSALIDDMLTLSSLDDQRFPLQIRLSELDTLLINSYEAFEPVCRKKAITLSLDLPDGILPLCLCDPNRISQVLSILLHNAVSYTKNNGKICLSLTHKDNRFCISVMDNGIGILDEDKNKIFDRFYRAEKSRNTKDHFGLGLSIAYEIVTAHHGSITVKDAPQGGSIFTVILPGK